MTIALVFSIVLAVVVAIEGWLLLHLLQQNGRILGRIEELESTLGGAVPHAAAEPTAPGLPVGTPAPGFRLTGLYGETMTLDALRAAGKPTLLVFTDPQCGPCDALMPRVAAWQREHAGMLTISIISTGSVEQNREKVARHGVRSILLQQRREVAEAYQAPATPSAVLVGADGTVASPLAAGGSTIEALLARALDGRPTPVAAQPAPSGRPEALAAALRRQGRAIPTVTLPDLDGNNVTVGALDGKPTVVLFWDPQCGFCQRMLNDLKDWERKRRAGTPELLVIAVRDAEENRRQGLRSTVLLDADEVAMQALGGDGTPTAVLLDARGNLISGAAIGAVDVLDMLNGRAVPPLPAVQPAPQPAGTGAAAAPMPTVYAAQLPAGASPAPAVRLPDIDGNIVELSNLQGRPTLLLFWNPGCGFCRRMLDDLKAWEANPPAGAPQLLVVSTGTAEANREQGIRSPVLLDQNFQTGRSFGASGTPAAVIVDANGNIASGVGVGGPVVLDMAYGRALPPLQASPAGAADGASPPALAPMTPQVGTKAPEFALPDLDGNTIELKQLRGQPTLLLFWSPSCGVCTRMLPDLKAWEANPPAGAPRLVAISSGSADANHALGLRSTVLLDTGFSVGRKYGARGTPSAVLLDARGHVASRLAVGIKDTLELAGAAVTTV